MATGRWISVVGKQGSKTALLVLTARVSVFEIIIKLQDKTQKSIKESIKINSA